MADFRNKGKSKGAMVEDVAITEDTLTSRGGLTLFVRYLSQIGIFPILEGLFGALRKSKKGLGVADMFKQILCFLVDGTSHHLVRFDSLKRDPGYAAAMESNEEDLLSSHSVKRFLGAFSWGRTWAFRNLMMRLFIWRLNRVKPKVIELGIDTMVMDNDEAKKREGVHFTYKKVKGFHPLQMTWDRFVIDAVFRGGRKHGNHGETVSKMIRRVVKAIREGYGKDVVIIIRLDSGFFDQDIFAVIDELDILYTCSGKLYPDIKKYVGSCEKESWDRYQSGKRTWDLLEFGDRRGRWDKFRRAIFTRLDYGEDQCVLEFSRPDSVIYTNIGLDGEKEAALMSACEVEDLSAAFIVGLHHGRGRDELVHRSLKEFGPEALPFRRFSCNTAFYYVMLLGLFLFECFKEDVCAEVVPITSYPNTVRRTVIDIAAKFATSGRRRILKVTRAVWTNLNFPRLWERAGAATPLPVF